MADFGNQTDRGWYESWSVRSCVVLQKILVLFHLEESAYSCLRFGGPLPYKRKDYLCVYENVCASVNV